MTDTAPDTGPAALPPDSHVHSEWSWDALAGSMEVTCERAVKIGLPAIAFTEHADFTAWSLQPGNRIPAEWRHLVSDDVLTPPALDLAGYQEISGRLRDQAPAQVLRGYLAETAALISGFGAFEVLAHIDYPVRYWPRDARPFDPRELQDEYRHVLRTLAGAGKILEVNTRVPLHPQILTWWRREGGQAITFASDAHDPATLAAGFAGAAHLAEAAGFTAGRDPYGPWGRNPFPV